MERQRKNRALDESAERTGTGEVFGIVCRRNKPLRGGGDISRVAGTDPLETNCGGSARALWRNRNLPGSANARGSAGKNNAGRCRGSGRSGECLKFWWERKINVKQV